MKNNKEKETNWIDTLPPNVALDGFVFKPSDSHDKTAFKQTGEQTTDYIRSSDKLKHMRIGDLPEPNFKCNQHVFSKPLEQDYLYTGSLERFGFDK